MSKKFIRKTKMMEKIRRENRGCFPRLQRPKRVDTPLPRPGTSQDVDWETPKTEEEGNAIHFTMLRKHMIYPRRNTQYAAGFDVVLPRHAFLLPKMTTRIPLSFRIRKCPVGYYFLMEGRSSFTRRFPTLFVRGVVDCDYKEEVFLFITNMSEKAVELEKGDCVAQMVLTMCACVDDTGMKTVSVAFREEDEECPTETQTTVAERGAPGTSFPLQMKDTRTWLTRKWEDDAAKWVETSTLEVDIPEEQDMTAQDIEGISTTHINGEVSYIIDDDDETLDAQEEKKLEEVEEEEEEEGEDEVEEVPKVKTLIINADAMTDDEDAAILIAADTMVKAHDIAELKKKNDFLEAGMDDDDVERVYLEGTCCTGKTTMAGEKCPEGEYSVDFMRLTEMFPYLRQKTNNVYMDMLYASVTSYQMRAFPKTNVWDRSPWSGIVYRFMEDEQAYRKHAYNPNWEKPTPRQHKFSVTCNAMRDLCLSSGLPRSWLHMVVLINTDLPFAENLIRLRNGDIEMAMPCIRKYVHAQNVIFRHVSCLLGTTPIVDMAKYKVGAHGVDWIPYGEEVADCIDLVLGQKLMPQDPVPLSMLQEYKY